MSWVPSRKRFVQFAALALLAGEISYAAAEVLILRSSGPSMRQYRAGQRVADNARFVLRPGDTVVILGRRGTRTFRGPGSFSATGPVRIGGLANLGGGQRVRVQTGAVRGPAQLATTPRPTDIWQFDVTGSGRACVLPGRAPVLWRPDWRQATEVTITPPTGAPQTVTWPAGQPTLSWPSQLPVVDGASYQLSGSGGMAPIRITLQTLSSVAPENLNAVAAAFLDRQCTSQLNVLIATRVDPEDSA